jgi:hypothetical protein
LPRGADRSRPGVISGAPGAVVDALAILAIVVLDAAIGVYREFNVEKSIAALKRMNAQQPRSCATDKSRLSRRACSRMFRPAVPGDRRLR